MNRRNFFRITAGAAVMAALPEVVTAAVPDAGNSYVTAKEAAAYLNQRWAVDIETTSEPFVYKETTWREREYIWVGCRYRDCHVLVNQMEGEITVSKTLLSREEPKKVKRATITESMTRWPTNADMDRFVDDLWKELAMVGWYEQHHIYRLFPHYKGEFILS